MPLWHALWLLIHPLSQRLVRSLSHLTTLLASGGKKKKKVFVKNLEFISATSPSPTLLSKTWNTKIWFLGKVKHFLTKDTWLTALREVMCHFAESLFLAGSFLMFFSACAKSVQSCPVQSQTWYGSEADRELELPAPPAQPPEWDEQAD